ncbi:hypothetical protein DBV15_04263 [Temnothorax longispinosus]|uniref:Uncharacterized protein n=1 Tax=Temnothorax longispinosus TaxID=300112 RepID=A0A4S2KLD7_9HYME|nr:hypothetical protein DBV15_04263 [Temnothorax longispinosus]
MHKSSAEQCGDAQPHAQLQANAQEEREIRMRPPLPRYRTADPALWATKQRHMKMPNDTHVRLALEGTHRCCATSVAWFITSDLARLYG